MENRLAIMLLTPQSFLVETLIILEMPTKAQSYASHILISPADNTGNQNSFSPLLHVGLCLCHSCFLNEVVCLPNHILALLPQCEFLINTFPLAFVCLSLFFFLHRSCSRSSLLPLLHVLLLSLRCSHFLLFLFSCRAGRRRLRLGSGEQGARERSKTTGEWPLLTAKTTKLFWDF